MSIKDVTNSTPKLPEDSKFGAMASTSEPHQKTSSSSQGVEQTTERDETTESKDQDVVTTVQEITDEALRSSAKQAPDRLTSHLPPINFGAVIPGLVFRSSFPLPENFSFLKGLKLKTILTLVPKPFPESYVEFMETNGIVQIVIPIPANKEVVCMDAPTIIHALGVVLDRSNYPMLVHCNKGKHRTGCVVACLRKIQGAAISTCLTEYHTYASPKVRTLDMDFIRSFDERTLLWMARENGIIASDEPMTDSPAHSPVFAPHRTRG